jgi:hypothetical protein
MDYFIRQRARLKNLRKKTSKKEIREKGISKIFVLGHTHFPLWYHLVKKPIWPIRQKISGILDRPTLVVNCGSWVCVDKPVWENEEKMYHIVGKDDEMSTSPTGYYTQSYVYNTFVYIDQGVELNKGPLLLRWDENDGKAYQVLSQRIGNKE